jgi:hypothetical protein
VFRAALEQYVGAEIQELQAAPAQLRIGKKDSSSVKPQL